MKRSNLWNSHEIEHPMTVETPHALVSFCGFCTPYKKGLELNTPWMPSNPMDA